MSKQNSANTSQESKIIQRFRDLKLNEEEIALISDREIASAFVRHLRAYLNRNKTFSHRRAKYNIEGILDDLNRSSERLEALNIASLSCDKGNVTWDDVTVDGDWEDIYPKVKLLLIEEVAKLMGQTVRDIENLIRDGQLLALGQGGSRGIRLPAEQFQRNKPIDGLADVLAKIDSHTLAWRYLTTPLWLDNSSKKPIDVLKSGNRKQISTVIAAAEGFGRDFS